MRVAAQQHSAGRVQRPVRLHFRLPDCSDSQRCNSRTGYKVARPTLTCGISPRLVIDHNKRSPIPSATAASRARSASRGTSSLSVAGVVVVACDVVTMSPPATAPTARATGNPLRSTGQVRRYSSVPTDLAEQAPATDRSCIGSRPVADLLSIVPLTRTLSQVHSSSMPFRFSPRRAVLHPLGIAPRVWAYGPPLTPWIACSWVRNRSFGCVFDVWLVWAYALDWSRLYAP